jgi:flagella basal body P-ring formation protein FlgA
MKQASNSLLTLCPILIKAMPDTPDLSQVEPGVSGRHFNPFCVHRENPFSLKTSLPGWSCPPRFRFRYRLGEGRIRSLREKFCRGFLVTCLASISICAIGADNQAIKVQEKNLILPRVRQVTFGEIKPVLVDYVLKSTPWKESEIEIKSVEGLKGIEVPEGKVSFNLLSGTAVAGHNGILALVEAVQDGKGVRCFWITAAVRINAEIVTASKRIPQGKRMTSDEVVRTLLEISDLQAGYFRNLEDVVGKTSRRTFSPGDPITRENVLDPFLIRHGDIVQLRLVRNGIALTSSVIAEQNGRLGDLIRVRNVEFSSILKAKVTGRAEVSID